jgi:ATP-dependent DNA helicase RecQ
VSGTDERTAEVDRTAREVFGWSDLHAEQREAIDALLDDHDVLAVLPTGAGKSAIYQLPALLREGPTVVVSPLLALQQDQIEALNAHLGEDDAAVAVNSAERVAERREAWQAVKSGEARYLFLAPEQLAKDDVVDQLAELDLGLFVVDEAHCVSAWGHDFRPDYLRLAPVIERLNHPPVVALTATAALPVRRDIVARLGLRDHREVVASFDRPNLTLRVEHETDDRAKRTGVITRVRALTADPQTRRGLLYTASRKDAEFYASELAQEGVHAAAYHAGMKAADRERVHEQFLADEVEVVCATSAFGMGIDKPDVRFVVHASAPESLDSYYQQIGRAGRDGESGEIVLFYRAEDLHLQRFLTDGRAPENVLEDVVEAVEDADGPVRPAELAEDVDASPAARTRAVNLLEQAGALTTTDDGRLDYVDDDRDPEQAVEDAVEVAEQHQELIRSRIEMMRGYAETTGCRRQFLLGYFGERYPHPCGNCDTCEAGTAQDDRPAEGGLFRRNAEVEHAEWGHGVVMSVEADRVTVLFDSVGYKTLARAAVEEQDLLAAS